MIREKAKTVRFAVRFGGGYMDYTEKTVNKNYVFKGKILTVRCDDALLPDGKPCTREMIEHGGGACVLYVKDGKVLLVKQYRYPYAETVYEIPAGKIDKGEDPEKTAFRELEEEGGIRAEKLQLLYVMYPSPGYTNEKIYIYRALDGVEIGSHLDEDEFLDVEYVPMSEIKRMLKEGKFNDGKTIIALQAWLLSEEN